MVQKCPDGPKRVPNYQKHLGLAFRTLLDPFGPLWNVDKPNMFGNFYLFYCWLFFGTPCMKSILVFFLIALKNNLFFIQLTYSGPERGNCPAAHGLSSCNHKNQCLNSIHKQFIFSDYCLLVNTTTIYQSTPQWRYNHQFGWIKFTNLLTLTIAMVIKLWQKGNNNLHIKRRGQGLRISASTLQEMVRVAFDT